MSEYRKEELSKVFMWILFVNILLLLTDIALHLVYKLDSAPDVNNRYTLWIIHNILAAYEPILLALVTKYFVTFLKSNTTLSKVVIYSAYVAVAASVSDIACIIATQFNHMYFILDENNILIRQKWYVLSKVFSFTSLAINLGICLSSKKFYNKQGLLVFMSYIILPILTIITHMLVENFSAINYAVTLSSFIVFAFIQDELSQKVKQKELEITKNRITIMLSQIQPHFLYNALTTIARLCDTDPKKAKASTIDFSTYLRSNMNSLRNENLISFEEELNHVKSYLRLEQAIYGDKMQVMYDIKTNSFLLPPLTIQPIVENAVKHGIGKKTVGGTIKVSSFETEDEYIIAVADDGIGFDANKPFQDDEMHIGMENVRQRLMQQRNGTVEFNSQPNVGTTAFIKIPKKEILI